MAREWSTRLPRRAEVRAVDRLTPTGTVLLTLAVLDDEPFFFAPGQFVAVDCDHPVLGYRRSPYCIASPPRSDRTFELLVRIVPEGPVSVFLGGLEPGDVIGFRGPAGAAMTPVPEDPDELVLVATGVGISPFCALIPTLLEWGFERPISLWWGLRLAGDVCLLDRLDAWTARAPSITGHRFRYHVSLSRPPAGWRGLAGRVTTTLPPRLATLRDKMFYLSGNGAMITELGHALALAGVPKGRIFDEYFFNLRHRPRPEIVEAIHARLAARDMCSPFDEVRELLAGGQ